MKETKAEREKRIKETENGRRLFPKIIPDKKRIFKMQNF